MTDTTLKLKQIIKNIEYLEEQKKEKSDKISAVYKVQMIDKQKLNSNYY